ncbi:hypothetical protein DFA_00282 [Cavenderia fasciculata]|uniref:Uncharacterized protein n=1 Tax=Cavenderia fasciculata TaxID=261658 RepID=F4PY44_CACFS|nr:uncharacterized protein DFA_00282 [Cavenderia fasciculata]EGG19704.1 hypothetical protein DFA_00282 [Cavenderia fasciculata]|eukprot:XP_004357998.1 hypothetical protein DFA_00282 [Cavenderia fasciculata]
MTNVNLTDNTLARFLLTGTMSTIHIYDSYIADNSNGDLTSSLIYFSGSDLVIDGVHLELLNVKNANGSVISMNHGNLVLQHTTVSESISNYGAIFLANTTADILNCTFSGNSAFSGAGAIYAIKGSVISIEQSTFRINAANFLMTDQQSNSVSTKLMFGSGGCFILQNSVLVSKNTLYYDNQATRCGGVAFLQGTSVATFTNNIFQSNNAYYGAGAICYSKSSLGCLIDNSNTFSENYATYGNIYATGPTTLVLTINDVDGSSNVTHLHPYTPFLATASLLDAYNQVVTVLPNPIGINITLLSPNNSQIEQYQVTNTLQGLMQVSISVANSNVTNEYVTFAVTTSSGFSISQDFYFTNCDPGYHPLSNITPTCVVCNPNTYGWDGQSCMSCTTGDYPTQVICPGSNQIIARTGWWIYPNSTPPDIYECDPDICLTGSCRPTQTGILCSVCEPGYRKVKLYCEECTSFNYYILAGMISAVGYGSTQLFVLSTRYMRAHL